MWHNMPPKRESFDASSYIRNFYPQHYDGLCYNPLVGSSEGLITLWQGTKFHGERVFHNEYAHMANSTPN